MFRSGSSVLVEDCLKHIVVQVAVKYHQLLTSLTNVHVVLVVQGNQSLWEGEGDVSLSLVRLSSSATDCCSLASAKCMSLSGHVLDNVSPRDLIAVAQWGWRSPQCLLGWHLGREEEW